MSEKPWTKVLFIKGEPFVYSIPQLRSSQHVELMRHPVRNSPFVVLFETDKLVVRQAGDDLQVFIHEDLIG